MFGLPINTAHVERIFETSVATHLLPPFPADIKTQTTKFVTMLDLRVADLRQLDKLVPAIEVLGVRHAAYGATAANYMAIRRVLLEALKAELRDLWTPELQAAWTSTYTLVATMMQAAAHRATAPAG